MQVRDVVHRPGRLDDGLDLVPRRHHGHDNDLRAVSRMRGVEQVLQECRHH